MSRYLILLTLVGVCLSLTATAAPQQQDDTPEGEEPYTPTRMEWFEMEMNASLGDRCFYGDDMLISYVNPFGKPNTLLIYVAYLPNADRRRINQNVEMARKLIEAKKVEKGWDWLKIEEKIVPSAG